MAELRYDLEDNLQKLYKVKLVGMQQSFNSIQYGISYVVARNPEEAYKKVRNKLDDERIGYARERELDTIELIADSNPITYLNTLLYL